MNIAPLHVKICVAAEVALLFVKTPVETIAPALAPALAPVRHIRLVTVVIMGVRQGAKEGAQEGVPKVVHRVNPPANKRVMAHAKKHVLLHAREHVTVGVPGAPQHVAALVPEPAQAVQDVLIRAQIHAPEPAQVALAPALDLVMV